MSGQTSARGGRRPRTFSWRFQTTLGGGTPPETLQVMARAVPSCSGPSTPSVARCPPTLSTGWPGSSTTCRLRWVRREEAAGGGEGGVKIGPIKRRKKKSNLSRGSFTWRKLNYFSILCSLEEERKKKFSLLSVSRFFYLNKNFLSIPSAFYQLRYQPGL